jgi:hypothetical protein
MDMITDIKDYISDSLERFFKEVIIGYPRTKREINIEQISPDSDPFKSIRVFEYNEFEKTWDDFYIEIRPLSNRKINYYKVHPEKVKKHWEDSNLEQKIKDNFPY